MVDGVSWDKCSQLLSSLSVPKRIALRTVAKACQKRSIATASIGCIRSALLNLTVVLGGLPTTVAPSSISVSSLGYGHPQK